MALNTDEDYFEAPFSPQQSQEKPFKCSDCGKSYVQKRHLKRHVNNECGKQPQLKCPQCPKLFTYNSSLKRHELTHLMQLRSAKFN
ncbi:zinc finger protein 525-like [Homalodisca vitripennis]|uniref:zinc finger protein 525-like n=1 Tax=Homalodisca vitripennis TaxID=197043 RepID=UPI001EEC1AF6|nr:zinc finger protein 525-like [Homalodisca vitripennis]